VLSSLPRIDLFLWGSSTLVTLILVSLIISWSLYRRFPFFTTYLLVNLAQTATQVVMYQVYGFNSRLTYSVIWATQIAVALMRILAAREFCQWVLGRYLGVWALAARVLAVCAFSVLTVAIYFGKDEYRHAVMTLEIAAEGFIATLVVGTFVFVRYYRAQIEIGALLFGLGLGLNSCLRILNDAVLSRFFKQYWHVWNAMGMIAFLCVLALWVVAMRAEARAGASEAPELHPAHVYRTLSPVMNDRLAQLNQHLIQLWKVEQPKL
jgi:hypothetical protein